MLLGILHRGEKSVSRTNLRQIFAEADLDVDYAHSTLARVMKDARGALWKSHVISCVNRNDSSLHVHAEDGGMGGINCCCDGHDLLSIGRRAGRIPSRNFGTSGPPLRVYMREEKRLTPRRPENKSLRQPILCAEKPQGPGVDHRAP